MGSSELNSSRAVRRNLFATVPERLLAVPADRLTPRLSVRGGVLILMAAATLSLAILAIICSRAIQIDLGEHAKFRVERLHTLTHTAKADLVAAGNLLIGQCDVNNLETLTRSSMNSVIVKRLLWLPDQTGSNTNVCSPFHSLHDPVVDQFQSHIEGAQQQRDRVFQFLVTQNGDLLILYRIWNRGFLAGQVSSELVNSYLSGNHSIDPVRVQLKRLDGTLLHDTWRYAQRVADEPLSGFAALIPRFSSSANSPADSLAIDTTADPMAVASAALQYAVIALFIASIVAAFSIAQINMALAQRASIERRLRLAVRRREFEPVIQPIVDAQTGRCQGGEILMRWDHPARGLLAPIEFLEVAESTGLIDPMTEVLMTKARDQLSDVLKTAPELYFSFNVTVGQLRHPKVMDWLDKMFDESSIPPENVVIELVERDAVDARVRQVLSQLRRRGYRVAIDDFGTGQSSLALLAEIDFDTLKIDREFVRSIDQESVNRPVLTAIIDLASQLGVHSIAEGVDTVAQHEFLVARGVSSIQGYLIAKPMPVSEFSRWFYAHQHKPSYVAGSVESDDQLPAPAVVDYSSIPPIEGIAHV